MSVLTLVFGCLLAFAPTTQAADVLNQVPRDALAMVVLRDLTQSDAKAGKLLAALGTRLPGPLAIVKSLTGIETGLDGTRDAMLVLLPPANNSQQFHLAVWLPTSDYSALVRSLEGDPDRRVAAVTIAGEDLLVVRHGDWAVVMDPDERDRLEQLREAQPSPPRRLAAWSTWIDRQNAAIILLPSGLRAFRSYAASQKPHDPAQNVVPADASDDPFGGPVRPTMPAGDDAWSAFDESLRKLLTDMPEIGNWLAEAEGAGCGLRIDAAGSAVIDLRLACARDALPPESVDAPRDASRPAPQLYDGGDFVVAGSGQVSPGWLVPAVAPYVRQRIHDLAVQFGAKFDDGDVAKFRTEIEQAVVDVSAFAVLTRPGKESEGVFTNNFLALRVKSPQAFLQRADHAIQLWNSMFESAHGEIRLVFKSRAITVADRKGTEYSIDMATAVGAPALPEIKPSMEKLFGPGGEFRLQFVALDDDTVLLAAANESQVAHVIESLAKATTEATDRSELRDAESLLAKPSDWRIYASPHGYNESLKRQMEAILGPVIGGPVVPDFPASPPVGVAGGVEGNVVWTELALPAETIRGIGAYLHQ